MAAPEVTDALPQHVRIAFGVPDQEPRPVAWAGQRAWQCGDALIRPVSDNAVAAWSAGVLDGLEVDGVRLARPLRSSDGRWVVAGWAACRFLPGTAEPRHDEVVAASMRLHVATARVLRPRLLDDRDDLLSRSVSAAFGERRLTLDPATGGALFMDLAAYRRPVRLVPQVVHGELFGSVLFDDEGAPAVLDLVPFWRPAEWAAAVIVVDALAWGGADEGLLERWAHLDEWPQALLRAVLYRLALHAQHPEASVRTLAGLERAAGLVVGRL
ncbi:TIGR02569 family protein [Pseudonocardia bannensis]|uniref:TIGR02569 family protein n=1 Tax=Pseudonocardia bannensis TaxID=630973 RepID=A0A848DML5_9PSEU|nr:TIGR02569 family protein [Pseudonocardia bannensis]NMH93624.1 TIGR02569 family protein [Pseudonocardia bannensis]